MRGKRPIEGRIRLAAFLCLLGLAVEAVTLNILHPISFIVFASAGVGLIVLGIGLYLLALLHATEAPQG